MKRLILPLLILFLLPACLTITADVDSSEAPEGQLRHVVLFKFKEGVSAQEIRDIEKALAGLPDGIDEIEDFEWGTQVSQSDRAKGFTHVGVFTFDNQNDLNTYTEHPHHKAFIDLAIPQVEDLLVFDYFAQD